MNPIALTLAVIAFAITAWTAAASALLCKMAGTMGGFRFPWNQWWTCLWWFGKNWWSTTIVIVAAIPPTIVLIVFGISIYSLVRSLLRRRQALFGQQRWADDKDLERGGVTTREKLL